MATADPVLDQRSLSPERGVGSPLLSLSLGSFLPNPNTSSDMHAIASGRYCATAYSRPPMSVRESGRTMSMVLLPGLLLAYN